jgi:hypothetical protein
MSVLDPSTVAILGPCIVTLDGATYYVEKDVKVTVNKSFKGRDLRGSFGTKFDDTLLDVVVDVELQPSMWKDTAKMFAILGKLPGQRVFGNTDKALEITSITEGLKYTYSRAAILEPPKIGAGVKKDLLGPMKVKCLRASASALSGANSIVAPTTGVTFSDTSFDSTKLFDVPFAVTYGDGSILGAADTEDGVDLDWEVDTSALESDQVGIYDYKVLGLRGKASLTPVGITAANLLALAKMQGTGVRRGAKMSTLAADLVLAGLVSGDPTITLANAYPGNSGMQGDVEKNLADKFEFISVRKVTNSALTSLVTFGTVA